MSEKPVGALALFPSAQALIDAIPKVRAKGLGKLEAYTPYPVHGLSEALGIKPSPLGTLVFVMAVLGVVAALALQWWTSAVDYPVRIGGKAFFSWQAFVPIMFELLVLFAAFTAGLGMLLLLNRLPWFSHPLLSSAAIAKTTRDQFALAIESENGTLDVESAKAALQEAGGKSFELLYPPALDTGRKPVLPLLQAGLVVGAAVAAGLAIHITIKMFPVLPPMNAMEVQKKAVPYRSSTFFADGRSMRAPVEGTVARGTMLAGAENAEEAGRILVNPLPRTPDVFAQGLQTYETFCQVCHGPLGEGRTSLSEAYNAKPANLHRSTIKDYPDGRIFFVISEGWNTMPGYAADLSADDRWAAVHYVRALQRSLDAEDEDLP